jgi:hypothetical protein
MLLPLVQSFVSGDQARLWDTERKALDAAYLQLLLEAYDKTVAPALNEPGSGSWATLIRLVRLVFTDGKISSLLDCTRTELKTGNVPASVHETVLHQLCTGLFEVLAVGLKHEMCIVLIESAAVAPVRLFPSYFVTYLTYLFLLEC